MTTTTKRQDFLGRWLPNAQPGTSAATDFLGRAVVTSDKDFLGRSLTFNNPSQWATGAAKSAGAYIRPLTGTNYDLILVALDAGTTHATTEPAWPTTAGGTVVDNAGVNQITWQYVYG